MKNTGYYLTPSGELRHAHPVTQGAPTARWHYASHRHPEYPTAHTDYQSWSQLTTVWATANRGLTPDQKAALIEAAYKTHEEV